MLFSFFLVAWSIEGLAQSKDSASQGLELVQVEYQKSKSIDLNRYLTVKTSDKKKFKGQLTWVGADSIEVSDWDNLHKVALTDIDVIYVKWNPRTRVITSVVGFGVGLFSAVFADAWDARAAPVAVAGFVAVLVVNCRKKYILDPKAQPIIHPIYRVKKYSE